MITWRSAGASGPHQPGREVTPGAAGFVPTSGHVQRAMLAICLLLLLVACRPNASASYRPPFIPVTFSINSNWQVSVSVGASIATFLGTFSVQSEVGASLSPGSTRLSIVSTVNGAKQKWVYDIGEHGLMTLCLNGQFEENVSASSIVVTVLNVPSQVDLVPANATASSCHISVAVPAPARSAAAPTPAKSSSAPAPTEVPIPLDAACEWAYPEQATGVTNGSGYNIVCLDASGQSLGGFPDGSGHSLNDWCADPSHTQGYELRQAYLSSGWVCTLIS
jgi:hypothetical protein